MIQKLLAINQYAFYTFDTTILNKRLDYLKTKLSNAELCYAVKANPFIVKELEGRVSRLETCSPNETLICLKMGIASSKLVVSGINKTPAFIEGLIKDANFKGIFTIESLLQYEQIKAYAFKYRHQINILLRLTNDSQFGINEADIEKIIMQKDNYLNIIGIQYFSGTQKTSIKKLKRELEYLDKFISHLKDNLGFTTHELEYGPGFPVAYFKDDEFDEDRFMAEFNQLLKAMVNKIPVVLELGRSIAASCGKYYSHIVDVKRNKNQNYIIIDGGMHHIVYFGQHMAMHQPKLHIINKEYQQAAKVATICGSLCSMNDIIAKQVALPDYQVGDVICFENTGAYSMYEGMALFLTRDLPALYLIKDDQTIIRLRQTFETLKLNMPNYERI